MRELIHGWSDDAYGGLGGFTVLQADAFSADAKHALAMRSGLDLSSMTSDIDAPPWAVAHRQMVVDGASCAVVSRLNLSKGPDSERLGRIAHHTVIESGDVPAYGPVKFIAEKLSDQIPSDQVTAAGSDGHSPISPAWANMIAAAVISARPITVIAPQTMHMDILQAAEALLDHEAKWRLTFVAGPNHFFSDVLVRLVESATDVHGEVIDISQPAPQGANIRHAPSVQTDPVMQVKLDPAAKTWPMIWLLLIVIILGLLSVMFAMGWLS